MNSKLHWDDLRIVLAVAVKGTLSGAGRNLGVSHATVYRRLGQIENRLGAKLFTRARTGYCLTLAGEEVVTAVKRIEDEVLQIERKVVGRDLHPSGTVRVTTTDSLFIGLMSPIFTRFRNSYPDINLEVVVSNELFDLSKREADVAIRPSSTPPEALIGRRIGTIEQAVYCRNDIASPINGEPDFHSGAWIGPDEGMTYRELERWMVDKQIVEPVPYRVNSVMGMFAAVRDGAGMTVLPCYLGDHESRLIRIGKIIPELSTDLWLLTHPDLRMTARVRALLDFVADAIRT